MGEISHLDARRGHGRRNPAVQEPLWREALGARLRRLRRARRHTLTELARSAGISPQYLSEVERGRKEPSSEMIAAISGALGLTLVELTTQVADELHRGSLSYVDFAQSSSALHPLAAPASQPSQSVQLSMVA